MNDKNWHQRVRVFLARRLCRGTRYVVAERDELDGGYECLDMVRRRLESLGLPMDGCPPMMYDDAISSLASRLGKYAGLTRWADVKRVVSDGYEKAEAHGKAVVAALEAQP